MSSYQIFRIALLTLSDASWNQRGISLSSSKPISIEEFHMHYEVVFVDTTGYLNLASKMSAQTFLRVKHEAALGLNMLNDEFVDNFDQLFIKTQDSQLVFDSLINIDPQSNALFYANILKKLPHEQIKLLDNFDNVYCVAASLISKLIGKALKDRIELIFTHSIQKQRVLYFYLVVLLFLFLKVDLFFYFSGQ